MNFSINVKTSEFTKGRLVKGPIWLSISDQSFPIDVWYDFPVVVLGWWLCNIKPLIAGQAVRCECPFMDGPYKVEILARKQADWTLTCIKDDVNGQVRLLEMEINPKLLVSEMSSSANIVVDLCKQKGWESDDLLTLIREVERVNALMRYLKQ